MQKGKACPQYDRSIYKLVRGEMSHRVGRGRDRVEDTKHALSKHEAHVEEAATRRERVRGVRCGMANSLITGRIPSACVELTPRRQRAKAEGSWVNQYPTCILHVSACAYWDTWLAVLCVFESACYWLNPPSQLPAQTPDDSQQQLTAQSCQLLSF